MQFNQTNNNQGDVNNVIVEPPSVAEQCWILTGKVVKTQLWHAVRRRMVWGEPCQVAFDSNHVIERDIDKGDIIGFMHTHPAWPATPSPRDVRTMIAQVDCLGKSLVCVIEGTDGLRGFWFDPDETEYTECEVVRFGGLLVGTTEEIAIIDDEPIGYDDRNEPIYKEYQ